MRTKQTARWSTNEFFNNRICGLYFAVSDAGTRRTYLPQVQLKSHTVINPVCFTTQLTQTFHNPSSDNIAQARYNFPLYDGVSVNGYTISYADKVLKGIVKQKDDAKRTYQVAADHGETAGLLESLPASIFSVTISNVPTKTDVVVQITYCGELRHDAAIDGLRYMLPTCIAPAYGTYPGEVLKSNTVANGGISITVDIDMAKSAIRRAQSPSHPIAVSMGAISTTAGDQVAFNPSQASATLTLGSAELTMDFVLQLVIDDIGKPQAFLETHSSIAQQRAIMATLVPKFTLEPAHPEIVFIADQSGSMEGAKNNALVSALKIFLKSLPLGVRFNICAFGSDFKFLWPKSHAYNEDNVNTALTFVDGFQAAYGGTEILEPIVAAFEQKLSDLPLEVMLFTDGLSWAENEVFRYINEQIHDEGVDARVFSLGVGSDVSNSLIEGVARAGNGFAQFVTQDEDTDQKVMRMLKGALYAHTKDYEMEVHYDDKDENQTTTDERLDEFEIVERVKDSLKIDELAASKTQERPERAAKIKAKSFFNASVDLDKPSDSNQTPADRYAHLPAIETPALLQAPSNIPPLFPFNRTTLYILLDPKAAQKRVSSVTLRATSAEGPLEINIPVNYVSNMGVSTIHQLAARKTIQDLEEGRGWLQAATITEGSSRVSVKKKYESRFDEIVEREAVRLGVQFQIASKWTSFVAVQDKMEIEDKMDVDTEQVNAVDTSRKRRIAQPRLKMGSPALASVGRYASFNTFNPPTKDTSSIFAVATREKPHQAFTSTMSNVNGTLLGSADGSSRDAEKEIPTTLSPSAAAGSLFGASHNAFATFGVDRPLSASGMSSQSQFGAPHGTLSATSSFCAQTSPNFCAPSESLTSFTAPSSEAAFLSSPVGGMKQFRARMPAGMSKFSPSPSPARDRSATRQQRVMPQGDEDEDEDSSESSPTVARLLEVDSEDEDDMDEDMGFAFFEEDAEAATAGRGMAPRKQLASKAARRAAPTPWASSTIHSKPPDGAQLHSMDSLIALQTFAGAWAWKDELFIVLGIGEDSVIKADLGGDAETRATALAIAFFEKHFSEKKEVWEMIVQKARAWLVKTMGGGEEDVDKMVEKAGSYF